MAWQPGESGNPGGRLKGYPEFRAACCEKSDWALTRILELAEGDDPRLALDALKFIVEQAWSKAPRAVTGEGGEGAVVVGLSAVPMTAEEWVKKYRGS